MLEWLQLVDGAWRSVEDLFMQSAVAPTQSGSFIPRLRFSPEIEREFQESYYFRMRAAIRTCTLLCLLLCILSVAVSARTDPASVFRRTDAFCFLGAYVLYTVLLVLSFRRSYFAQWQLVAVAATLVYVTGFVLTSNELLTPYMVICATLIWSRLQRLQTRAMSAQIGAIVALILYGVALFPRKFEAPQDIPTFIWTGLITLVVLIWFSVPFIATFKAERFDRSEFLIKHLLAQERNEERLRREQTEKMLHVLSQAIGGIVHDLGNPLMAVQGGAQTLLDFAKSGDADSEMVQEFAEMITDGAQMLNYLRLSLMEQTRVLENKPVPVKPALTSIRDMVKAGAHYQKPRFSSGREVSFDGDDMQVYVDEMRFITVFMNLIGNALKYSDGQVRVSWRVHDEHVLIAVQDQGQLGQGISRAQAEKLFVAFGRLDTHAQIEGTGLGLLSVRKIAEAHHGEVYIEGFESGTTASAPFALLK